jgi:DNA polymerase-3 subunit gamma/tau
MLEVSEIEAASLAEQSRMADAHGLTRMMEVFAEAEMRLREASSKKILVEVTLLKAIEARNAVSLDSVLQQLRTLREDKSLEVVSLPIPATVAPLPSAPKPFRAEASAVVANPAADSATITAALREQPIATPSAAADSPLPELWRSLVEAVGRVSPFIRSYLREAHPVSFAKNVLTIGFDPEFEDHIALVDVSRNHTLLQTKLAELGHANVQFKFVKAEAPASWQRTAEPAATTAPAIPTADKKTAPGVVAAETAPVKEKLVSVPFSKDDFKNDPLIQKALEIFKGQIVEVRA